MESYLYVMTYVHMNFDVLFVFLLINKTIVVKK